MTSGDVTFDPGAELDGDVKTPPPARHGKLRPPARRGLSSTLDVNNTARYLLAELLRKLVSAHCIEDIYIFQMCFTPRPAGGPGFPRPAGGGGG